MTLLVRFMKRPSMTVLIMLDLSAAFDVVGLPILLKRLEF